MNLRRTWIEISGDKRKLSVLAMGVTLGLLLWARVIVIAKMPRQAVADPIEGVNIGALLGEFFGPEAGGGGRAADPWQSYP